MLRSWWLRFVALVLCVALFVYGFRVQAGWVKQLASYFVYPVLLVQHIVVDPIKQQHNDLAHVEDLQKELNALKQEYQDILAENVQLRATLSYMNTIEELHEFKKRYSEHEGKISQVLARHFSDQEHYFYVDAGSNDNIAPDMAVVYKNNLIGKVVEVYPWYSKIALVTDRHCKVAAYCSKTQAHGIHLGANNETQTALSYVDHLSSVQQGDLVLSSGEGMVFPQGFALGTVKSAQKDDLYHRIEVEPCCDLRRLDYCTILTR